VAERSEPKGDSAPARKAGAVRSRRCSRAMGRATTGRAMPRVNADARVASRPATPPPGAGVPTGTGSLPRRCRGAAKASEQRKCAVPDMARLRRSDFVLGRNRNLRDAIDTRICAVVLAPSLHAVAGAGRGAIDAPRPRPLLAVLALYRRASAAPAKIPAVALGVDAALRLRPTCLHMPAREAS
jgi:hypothetical protein